ncbi:hypothetical protein [Sediminibacterium goheungense]|uniref:Uncharacterized protein n=1 Tax=Sediminibacterium goheungense TaxID=1086393 RepID=A0A4R6IMQ7_9BACT|nr:hypothetical protein [Sediminibacterium goheungense]TDO23371.1 hypothetical protein BC659_3376 [Sediminibacterium goheungense]
MKNTSIKLSILFLLVFLTESLIAQPPPFWFLQSVAKDNQGNPARNRTIHIRSAIYQGRPVGGTLVFEESHQVQSDNDGVFGYTMGRGIRSTNPALKDSLNKIEWGNGPYFINTKIAISPSIPAPWWIPANNYVDIGTSQIMSVPYALYAGNASVTNVNTNIAAGPPNTFLTTDSLGNVNWTTPQAAQVSVTQVSNFNLNLNVIAGQNARIAANTTTVIRVPVTNAKQGDPILITALDDYQNWTVYGAWCKEDGFVNIRFANFTAQPVDVLGSLYKIVLVK